MTKQMFCHRLPPLSALPERFAGPKAHHGGALTAGCSFGGRMTLTGDAPLSSGDTSWTLASLRRLSVLLPERSNCCDQRFCAFGGCLSIGWTGQLSPDAADSTCRIDNPRSFPRLDKLCMNRSNYFLCLGFVLVLTLVGCGTSVPVQRGWQSDAAAGRAATGDSSVDIPARLSPGQAEDVTLYALGLVGTPYRYGGNTPDGGFDCSGLIDHVYQARVGLKAPRTVAKLQYWGAPVPDDALRSGDLVLFSQRGAATHAGIYVGEGRFVHAPSSGGTVRLDDLNSRYWASQRLSFRRP